MTPQEALDLINAEAHTTYTLNSQYSGGEDSGAFSIVAPDGTRAVLKINRNPMWINQVQRAKAATLKLKTLGYPAPTYAFLGSTDRGTYSVQSELPGQTTQPTVEGIQSLLGFIELQKGQAISEVSGQDWVWYISDVVFRGESGHVRAMMQFGPQTSALVSEVEGLVSGLQGKMLPKTDLVHGDMSIGQVLFQGTTVSGVVDWDQAGYGDRTYDLTALWYSILDFPEPRDAVMKHLLEVSDLDSVKIYAAYKMLSMVAWHINKVGGDVDKAVAQARSALDLLKLPGSA
jgi:thiamine kinase-like enzyme